MKIRKTAAAVFINIIMIVFAVVDNYAYADNSHSCDYMYNVFETDAEREFYDDLLKTCEAVDNNTYTYEYTPYVQFTRGLSLKRGQEVAFIFTQDHPEFFWLSSETRISSLFGVGFKLLDDFSDGKARQSAKAKIVNAAQVYIDEAMEYPTEFERAKFLHDELLKNTAYQFGDWDQTIASVFLKKNTVCAGFSKSYEYLCNACGINCIVITSANHAWNAVQIGKSWYLTDVTNDRNSHKYFLISDVQMHDYDVDSGIKYTVKVSSSGKTKTYETYLHDIDKLTYTEYYDNFPSCPLSYSEAKDKKQDPSVYIDGNLLGDANLDGMLNVRDAAFIARILSVNKSNELPECSDFNRDGKKNVRDAAVIARYLANN